MTAEFSWESVQVGDEIPPLIKQPTSEQLVRYAGASGDFAPIHYDDAYARSHGLPGVIVHGLLKRAFLVQLLTDWLGDQGRLRKIGCRYRGTDRPGDILTCKGKVTNKYVQDGTYFVECEVWIENEAGEITTAGTATATLIERSAR